MNTAQNPDQNPNRFRFLTPGVGGNQGAESAPKPQNITPSTLREITAKRQEENRQRFLSKAEALVDLALKDFPIRAKASAEAGHSYCVIEWESLGDFNKEVRMRLETALQRQGFKLSDFGSSNKIRVEW